MRFVVVSNHDSGRDSLCNHSVLPILDREYNLKSCLLILVPAVACDPHRSIHLNCSRVHVRLWTVTGSLGWRLRRRCLPLLYFLGVKDNDTLGFILVPGLLLFDLLDLLPCSTLALPSDAARTYLNVSSTECFVDTLVFGCAAWGCHVELQMRICSTLESPFLNCRVLHRTAAHQCSVQL